MPAQTHRPQPTPTPWESQRFSSPAPEAEVAPELQSHQGHGNAAMLVALAELAVANEEAQATGPTDAEQVEASQAAAESAQGEAQSMRARLDAKLEEMKRIAGPHIEQGSAAYHVLMRELSPMLPPDLTKAEIAERIGFHEGSVGGVTAGELRQGDDPARPQMVLYTNEEGEKAADEKMASFKKARVWGEAKRAASRGLTRLFGGSTDRSVTPAMTVLFDTNGLDAGITEANEALNGAETKQIMGGMATDEALREAGSAKRLHKAATGQGFGGGIANRIFRKKMPAARGRAQREGLEGRDETGAYVAKEAKAQLLAAKAKVEAQMVDNGIDLSTVSIGAVFDPSQTNLSPNTLNLFVQTKDGRNFHLQDIGGKVSFAKGEAMEALTSELHADGELTGPALAGAARGQGLYPTAQGGFAQVPGDLTSAQRKALQAELQELYGPANEAGTISQEDFDAAVARTRD